MFILWEIVQRATCSATFCRLFTVILKPTYKRKWVSHLLQLYKMINENSSYIFVLSFYFKGTQQTEVDNETNISPSLPNL
jgi:hypothetical protein